MPTDQYLKLMEAENVEALHLALTPFRLLRDLLRAFIAITFLGFMVVYVIFGAFVNIGPHSKASRDEWRTEYEERLDTYDTYSVHFSEPPSSVADEDANRGNMLADGDGSFLPAVFKPFQTFELGGRSNSSFRFSYCGEHDPGSFDATLAPMWKVLTFDPSARGLDAFARKSARMRRDYEIGGMMIGALRSTLTHLKAGMPLDDIYGPKEIAEDAEAHPKGFSYCTAAPVESEVHPKEYAAYIRTMRSIKLVELPVIRFRYIFGNRLYGDRGKSVQAAAFYIWGMCIEKDCGPDDLHPITTYMADATSKLPPLSDNQVAAEEAILRTATWQYWSASAMQNGIKDLAPVRVMYQKALADTRWQIGDADFGK